MIYKGLYVPLKDKMEGKWIIDIQREGTGQTLGSLLGVAWDDQPELVARTVAAYGDLESYRLTERYTSPEGVTRSFFRGRGRSIEVRIRPDPDNPGGTFFGVMIPTKLATPPLDDLYLPD